MTGQLRDRIAAAIEADCRKAIPPAPPLYPGDQPVGGWGRSQYDIADAVLAVVQPELDRFATIRQLASALGDYLPGDGWELAHAIERLASGEITPAEALAETDG